jgi:hypothetical protein
MTIPAQIAAKPTPIWREKTEGSPTFERSPMANAKIVVTINTIVALRNPYKNERLDM